MPAVSTKQFEIDLNTTGTTLPTPVSNIIASDPLAVEEEGGRRGEERDVEGVGEKCVRAGINKRNHAVSRLILNCKMDVIVIDSFIQNVK